MAFIILSISLVGIILLWDTYQRSHPEYDSPVSTLQETLHGIDGQRLILYDVVLQKDLKAVADCVLLHEKGIFILYEIPLSGRFYGNPSKREWEVYTKSGEKLLIPNPLWDIQLTQKVLAQKLGLPNACSVHPILVLSNHADLSNFEIKVNDVWITKERNLSLRLHEFCCFTPTLYTKSELSQLAESLPRTALDASKWSGIKKTDERKTLSEDN